MRDIERKMKLLEEMGKRPSPVLTRAEFYAGRMEIMKKFAELHEKMRAHESRVETYVAAWRRGECLSGHWDAPSPFGPRTSP